MKAALVKAKAPDTRSLSCFLDLGKIPESLNSAVLEQYLLVHGTGPRAKQCP
jgi:hypothetical protein